MFASSAQAPSAAVTTHDTRPRATIWVAYGLLAILLACYAALKILRGGYYSTLIDGWMVVAFELTASGLCLARGFRGRSGRAVAFVLGAALLSWSLGHLALTVESVGGATPSTPSLADAFYLGYFPLAYVAVVLLMRGETRPLMTPSWLDGAVAGLGAAAVCAAFAFHSLLQLTGGDPLEVATKFAYPIGDLLLLFLVVGGTAVLSGRRKAPWLLLATGVAINIAGDTFNLFESSAWASPAGTVVNALAWPASILLTSIAVWMRRGTSDPLAAQRPPGFLLPGLGAAAGLAILVFATFHATSGVAIGLAVATLLVVGVRFALSTRGLRDLTLQRYRQSLTDDLTDLGNRRYLFHILDSFFADEDEEVAPTRSLAFLFVDLDHFKELNDAFGHSAGDEVLKQLGTRLRASLRDCDALVRLGGDEFAVLLMNVDAHYATTIAKRLTASLEEPFILDAVSPSISASIGIALAPSDATDSASLVWCADIAMFRAKSGGAPFALYEHGEDFDGGGNRLRLAEELRLAIKEGQLVLHYQPQLGLGSREISNVEALLRWPHPRLGLVPPLKFLPVAEEAGLMQALSMWVLQQALEQCAAWRAAERRVSVAVNVSATNLLEVGFVELIRDLLERYDLAADALVLELTETSIIKDFERSRLVIEKLRDMGIVVSIDDFGAGFTSLAYLGTLAVGELKLDRTFITRLAGDEPDRGAQLLVRATIELGHTLGLRIVAEGVEDHATLSLLADFGCDLAQGYFIDMPLPAEELTFLQPANGNGQPAALTRRRDRGRDRPLQKASSAAAR
jgi:diguanylate cyclase